MKGISADDLGNIADKKNHAGWVWPVTPNFKDSAYFLSLYVGYKVYKECWGCLQKKFYQQCDSKIYIKVIFSEVSTAISFLKQARNFLSQDTWRTLYKGAVELHFRYCFFVWDCCGKTDLNQLQMQQMSLNEKPLKSL